MDKMHSLDESFNGGGGAAAASSDGSDDDANTTTTTDANVDDSILSSGGMGVEEEEEVADSDTSADIYEMGEGAGIGAAGEEENISSASSHDDDDDENEENDDDDDDDDDENHLQKFDNELKKNTLQAFILKVYLIIMKKPNPCRTLPETMLESSSTRFTKPCHF